MPIQQPPGPIGSVLQEINKPGLFGTEQQSVTVFTTSGSWIAPANVFVIKLECWGGGAGGQTSGTNGGGGGGGGEYAADLTLQVTPGNTYNYTVGTGGGIGANGNASSFPGDAITVTANGGQAGNGGTGGTGSFNAVHFTGGNGGVAGSFTGGAGGGASASSTGSGTGGVANGSSSGAAGGIASGDGGPGASGGSSGAVGNTPGTGPGGGGGGGGGGTHAGGAGFRGQIRLTYIFSTAINTAVAGLSGRVFISYQGGNPKVASEIDEIVYIASP